LKGKLISNATSQQSQAACGRIDSSNHISKFSSKRGPPTKEIFHLRVPGTNPSPLDHHTGCLDRRQLYIPLFVTRFYPVLLTQQIIGYAELTAGEQRILVLVMFEGPRLANQPVNDMAVVDGVTIRASQPGQLLR
jgi:hypothetical protein